MDRDWVIPFGGHFGEHGGWTLEGWQYAFGEMRA